MNFEERIDTLNNGGVEDKRSYTVKEVEVILGTRRQNIYKLIEEGYFETLRVDGRYRIMKRSFDQWLEGGRN